MPAKFALAAAGLAGAGLAAGVGALGYAYFIEPQRIELERLTFRLPGAAGRLPAAGLRILLVTDSHFSGRDAREHAKIERVCRLVQGVECDLVIHAGDFIHYDSGLENVATLLDALPKPTLGSYGVFGNHDYTHYNMGAALPRMWETFSRLERARAAGANGVGRLMLAATRWLRYVRYVRNTPLDGRRTGTNDTAALTTLLAQHGMQLLHNRTVHLHRPAGPAQPGQQGHLGDLPGPLDVYLAGVDDVFEGRPRLGDTLAPVPEGAPVILISHNPDIIASPRLDRVALVLAGHTHGGQLVLPLWGPAHTQSAYLPRRHVAGSFRHGATQFYVSRGLGEGIPLRFGARPQLALITLVG